MGMPRKRRARSIRALRRLLRASRDRWLLECAICERLAEHYVDFCVGSYSVEMAGRISSPSFDCAASVIAAFPDTPELSDLLEHAAQGCKLVEHPGCTFIDKVLSARHAGVSQ